MYPTLEDENRTWAGRFDLIMVTMKNVKVQVCLSNSKIEKLLVPIRSFFYIYWTKRWGFIIIY